MLFMYQSAEWEYLPREQRLAHLREVFAGMSWLTQQFLSDVSPAASVFMDAVIQIQMPTWHHGRVALVGDACDCPTLLSGQGASLAMGGAYLLARALHETADYQQAFHRYEQQMFAYVQAQHQHASGTCNRGEMEEKQSIASVTMYTRRRGNCARGNQNVDPPAGSILLQPSGRETGLAGVL